MSLRAHSTFKVTVRDCSGNELDTFEGEADKATLSLNAGFCNGRLVDEIEIEVTDIEIREHND